MSGASPPLRSLWFGEGLTSATTEDSGRNSDATIHAPDVCRSRLDLRNTKSSSRQAAAIVQKQRCETSSPARARARPRSGCGKSPDVVAGEPHPKTRRPGRPVADPTVQLRDAFRPAYATHSTFPTNTLLAHRPRQTLG